jgi:hypothetical protein
VQFALSVPLAASIFDAGSGLTQTGTSTGEGEPSLGGVELEECCALLDGLALDQEELCHAPVDLGCDFGVVCGN